MNRGNRREPIFRDNALIVDGTGGGYLRTVCE